MIVGDGLDSAVSPRGYRLLTKVPRLPPAIVDRLVDHFERCSGCSRPTSRTS